MRIKTILYFLILVAVNGSDLYAQKKSPNVVVIYMDDMGYGDLGCFGATDYETPNINQMATEGMRFTNFLAPQAVCSASRAGLLTGCYPNRIGLAGALFPDSKKGINTSETMMAELFKQKGYTTAIFGKWHLGTEMPFLPLQRGFDVYFGLPYSNDMWPYGSGGKVPESKASQSQFGPLPLMEGNTKVGLVSTMEDQSRLTGLFTERAVQFIKQNKKKPFFLYIPQPMPHVPLAASEKFKGKSGAGVYGDVMMELDWSVGEVMKTIREQGLEDNTLIVLTSDNGPWRKFGNWAGSTGGLREGKTTVFEGGQRVSCVMKWKGTIPAGTVGNKLSSSIDLLPTFVAICGLKMPANKIDGVDITDLLKGKAKASPRRNFYYYFDSNALKAVRRDDWKLMLPHDYFTYEKDLVGKDGVPGKTTKINFPMALYDLRQDPGERYDLQESYPEIVQELQKLAEEARADLGDDLKAIKGSNRRPVGIVTN